MATSDVARLRQQIEDECEAMQRAMTGFAQTASHEVINQRFQHLDVTQQQLALLVGEHLATQIVVETYVRMMG
jgi:hypothetical protein